GRSAEVVEDDARLDARRPRRRVDREHAIQVLREVDDDRDVRALAGEARPAAAREHRRAVVAADRHRRDDVVDRPRDHDPDRHLPVVRAARRVEGAIPRPEPHLALELAAEVALEPVAVEPLERPRRRPEGRARLRWDADLGHAAYRSASARLSSSPWPGRERSGRSAPPSGSSTPSKRSRSTRTWSWNHSRFRRIATALSACAEIAGAQCPEISSPCDSASAAAL